MTVLGLVCEGPTDERVVAALAQKVTGLPATLVGVESPRLSLRWIGVKDLAEQHQIRAHGHFDGEPGVGDAHTARKALRLFRKLRPDVPVVLMRDDDRDRHRRQGLEQARHDARGMRVAVGLAHPCIESWILATIPTAGRDGKRVTEGRFDVLATPARCSADTAKAAVEHLESDHQAQHEALVTITTAEIEHRDQHTGLVDFLGELARLTAAGG